MIKLTWRTLNEEKFLNTLKKLRENEAKLPVQAKYRLALISQSCYFEMLKAQAEAKKLLEKYAKKDEKGGVLGFPDPQKVQFETKELEAEHDNAFKEMLMTKFKINSHLINVEDLSGVELTSDELLSIKEVLKDI